MPFRAGKCSHYCPDLGTTIPPTESATAECKPGAVAKKNGFSIDYTTDVCAQVDVKLAGIVELNFAFSGSISLELPTGKSSHAQDNPHSYRRSHSPLPLFTATGGLPKLTAKISLGGGFTVGLIFVKASFYAEGSASITATLPKVLYACSSLVDVSYVTHRFVGCVCSTSVIGRLG